MSTPTNTPDRPRQNPRTSARRETVQILLTPDLHAVLRARAVENGETVSALGARILEAGLTNAISTATGRAVFEALAVTEQATRDYAEAAKSLTAAIELLFSFNEPEPEPTAPIPAFHANSPDFIDFLDCGPLCPCRHEPAIAALRALERR